MSRRVFVDTGAFFALLNAQDEHHPRAEKRFNEAHRKRWRLVTTNAVVWESYSLFLNRSRTGRQAAAEFLDMLNGDPYRVEWVRKADHARAVALVGAHEDKAYSLVDALSFVVMERLEIEEALAFDRHFRSYGKIRVL